MIFQKVHGLKQKGDVNWMATVFIAVLILTIAIWFGGWIVRRRFKGALRVTPLEQRLRLASRVGVLVMLGTIVAWVAAFAVLLKSTGGITGVLVIAYILGALGVLGALAVLAEAGRRVLSGPGGWLVRCGEGLLALCALWGLWAIFAFGLASFSFHF
jgi:heme/copper-type cytochrome/quinol oxidase subunit 3